MLIGNDQYSAQVLAASHPNPPVNNHIRTTALTVNRSGFENNKTGRGVSSMGDSPASEGHAIDYSAGGGRMSMPYFAAIASIAGMSGGATGASTGAPASMKKFS